MEFEVYSIQHYVIKFVSDLRHEVCLIQHYVIKFVSDLRHEVYLIQHYVIKFVSDLRQVGCFLHVWCTTISSTNKIDHYDITEILLKVTCYSIFSFMCMFCRSLFVLLYFFFWPLFWLFFFDIQILITPLISSNSSYYNPNP